MASVYDPKEFALWLTQSFEASHFKSWQAVAESVGTTRSTLSRLAGAKPQSLTGKPGKPNADLVIRLAELFDRNVNDALMKGGHSPIESSGIASAITARVALLEKNLTKEEQAEVILEIGFAVDVLMRRIEERRKKDA